MNVVKYYNKNFAYNAPEEMVYAIFTLDQSWHIASFKTKEQLDKFANSIGFTYTWDGTSGKTSIPIMDNPNRLPEDGNFNKLNKAYHITDEQLKVAKPIKCLSNGSIVDNYFINDGQSVTFYRCNPNYQEFYKSLPIDEHIKYHQEHGIF